MKKTTKIITLILSAVLLIGAAIGISVSAEEETPTVRIAYKNIAYEGAVKILYAVEAQNIPEGAKVQMAFFDTMPESANETPKYLKDEYAEEITIGDVSYKAFFSEGIAPKDMRKSVYAVPVITKDGEPIVIGDPVAYSIYNYGINMFEKTPTADQKALYTSLLDYGASVQKLLLGTEDYTAEDLAAAGGYADEYCGIKVATAVDNAIALEGELLGYYAPGTAIELSADLYYEGAMFTGFIDENYNAVADFDYTATAYASEPGINNFYKTYRSDVSVNNYNEGYIHSSASYSYASSVGYTNNYYVGKTANNAIVNYGTEEAPNYALKHTHTDGAASGSVNFPFATTGKAYIFESDFCFGGVTGATTSDNWQGRIGFVSNATNGRSSEKNFTGYTFMYAKDGEAMTIEGATLPVGEWVRFRFEFIPLEYANGAYQGAFRVYKEGELVKEKIMSTDVDNSDCLRFEFGTRTSGNAGGWDMMLDNTVCYTVTGNTYGTGEYNALANSFDESNSYNGVTVSGGSIVEELDGNKVYEFTSLNGKSPSLTVKLDKVQQGQKYVFDTDIQWVEMPVADYGRTWIGRYGFISQFTDGYSEDDKFVRANSLTATPAHGAFLHNSSSGGSLSADYLKNYKLNPGTWYNLRFEYTIDSVDADGYYIGTQTVYLNGEVVRTATQKETMMTKYQADRGVIKNPLNLVSFALNTLSPNTSTLRLDNTYLGVEGECDLYRYNDFANTVNKASSYPYLSISASETDCVSEQTVIANPIATDAKSAANNVLKVVTNTDTVGDKDYRGENTLNRSQDIEEAQGTGVYELEFDMAIDPSAILPKDGNIFQQFVLNSGSGYVYLFRFTHTADGLVTINSETGGTKPGKGGNIAEGVKLLDGEWHNVRFVVYKNGTESAVSIYVDGELAGTKSNIFHNYGSAEATTSAITTVTWRIKEYVPADDTATSATYYFDNMGFRYVGELPETIPGT